MPIPVKTLYVQMTWDTLRALDVKIRPAELNKAPANATFLYENLFSKGPTKIPV